jgi:hypothetical protein
MKKMILLFASITLTIISFTTVNGANGGGTTVKCLDNCSEYTGKCKTFLITRCSPLSNVVDCCGTWLEKDKSEN